MRSTIACASLIVLVACAPSVEECQRLLPVNANAVLAQTPAGTHGCSCVTEEGVVVIVEAKRSGFSWTRGKIWIDGVPVAEQEFATRLAEARARRRVEAAAAQMRGTAAGVKEQTRKVGRTLSDLFRR